MEGFRIKRQWSRISADLVEAFRDVPVANVSDCMNRLTGTGALVRMHREGYLAGPAFTVRSPPGDNLMLHKALDMAQPGDVIVHDAGGGLTNALIGELMVAHAQERGIAGIVIHGAVRDRDMLYEMNLPVYALGVCHRGPYKNGPGEIGFDVAIGGMTVRPGDLVIGDGDGLLAIPRDEAEGVLERAKAKGAAESKQMADTRSGTLDRSWIDSALQEMGCEFVD
jgi:RraA family protein